MDIAVSSEPAAEARSAATVIALRDGDGGMEVLLLRRNPELRTMGGAWVFPGGKVDSADPGATPEEQALHAAVRELEEEAGVVLSVDSLEYFSHWLTPVRVKHRFATWFYIATLPPDTAVRVDGGEIVAHQWLRPADAIAAQSRGDLSLPPPTLVTLQDLADSQSADAAKGMAARRRPPYFFPVIVTSDDTMFFLYPGDSGYETANPEMDAIRHRTESRDGCYRYYRDFDWPARGG